ncbi:hypothetical protein PsYK624_145540 [Phanerochaete sordida]|uniref:DUF6533 domain-containing protein n=1 Tax=Phanerochaete sordida TaxID=48140 RepID=A0A9P3GP77_9APHY|nr:hypothetical protein PsYK624_145540 [Phanerochaete sordida]
MPQSDETFTPAEMSQDIENMITNSYISTSLLSLVIYELAITLDQEVSLVWRRRITATSLLLISTRWTMLLALLANFGDIVFTVYVITPRYKTTGALQCTPFLSVPNGLLYIMGMAQGTAFSCLRVYALLQQSKQRNVIVALVASLGCVPIATNAFTLIASRSQIENFARFSACMTSPGVSKQTNDIALCDKDERDRERCHSTLSDVG